MALDPLFLWKESAGDKLVLARIIFFQNFFNNKRLAWWDDAEEGRKILFRHQLLTLLFSLFQPEKSHFLPRGWIRSPAHFSWSIQKMETQKEKSFSYTKSKSAKDHRSILIPTFFGLLSCDNLQLWPNNMFPSYWRNKVSFLSVDPNIWS